MTAAARGTFRWWPVDGGRHAIPGELQPGQTGETLCRHPVTYSGGEPCKREWLWPTCSICYEAARSCTHVSRASRFGVPWQRAGEPTPDDSPLRTGSEVRP
ncbi:zinc finger protein [Goodfellowiella coeruleoviolacea]|uniref:Zinc-finger n=1 Tax=Goodfellowiella coeruleoviolacea TaxID=334858 RepID=A0AAE3KK15_9PSEU|nr:zinc finger protein [Goodfellowiella coeruleoviolacea]MCP2169702.1 zinc-finger [Goodfellowiella coeruleoviolacea]